uniref:Uncharacterized protein n=1 Tax=Arundo donax TaxID=35708 RepID=A0A0A9A5W2_ARUDO
MVSWNQFSSRQVPMISTRCFPPRFFTRNPLDHVYYRDENCWSTEFNQTV